MEKTLNKYVRYISTAIIALSIGVLIGWQLNITALKSVLPGLIAMNPFTALCFIATAGWQMLRVKFAHRSSRPAIILAFLLAIFVFATGVLKIFDEVTTQDYAFDDFLYKDQIGLSHMSQQSAFCLTLFGVAMIISGLRWRKGNIILLFIVPVFILSMISFFGYVIGNNHIDTMKPFKPMALHSSASFLALTASFLFLFPKNSILEVLLSRDSGGYIARKLLPYVLAVPFVISYLRYQGERLGFYDTGFGVAIFMVSSILTFLLIVVRQAKALSEIDNHRRKAEKNVAKRSEELASANKELERRNKELEQFAYAASHDMQEPLRKIHTFSNFLLQHNLVQMDEKGKGYLNKISSSVLRMKSIIDDLLNYSHHTRDDDTFVPTDLNSVIEAIEGDLDLMIREKSATIKKDPLPTIKGVPSQMHQLFYNLLTNALKFAKPGIPALISISCKKLPLSETYQHPKLEKDRPYVQVCVTDNGIGFSQEYAEKIFGLFTRLHGKNQYTGTGIGLALCKKVTENHKGTIWAESKEGSGTTFHVILPTA